MPADPSSPHKQTDEALRAPLHIGGLVVVAIMAAALIYAVYISLANWASIAV